MEDDASILLDGKTLANLRVVDLKLELEKRGLSKSGSKKDLVKRLKQQLEFEKLSSERKSTGDCDLKLELDADTEQNEFVQQYLAQQQKIYAEQKEVKRRVELEEIQKSGDEKESCDSAKDDDKTEDEAETTNQSAITDSSLSHKYAKSKKEDLDDVFKVEDTVSPPSVSQDARNTEEAREKELSTAISSLLSVEKTESKVEENEVYNEDIALVEAPRSTHDDDREKDLATAVLSSLLVKDQEETESKEEVSQEEVAYNAAENPLHLSIESDVNNLEIQSNGSETKNVNVLLPVEDACNTTEVSSELQDVQPSQLPVHDLETKAKDAGTKNVEVVSQIQNVCQVTPLQLSTESDVQSSQLSVDPDVCCSETGSKDFETTYVEAATPVEGGCNARQVSSQLMGETNVLGLETKYKDLKACEGENATVIVPTRSSEESGIGKSEPKGDDVLTGLPVVEPCKKDITMKLDVQNVAKDVDRDPVASDIDKKSTTESCEITRSAPPEMSAKMDVSSVPYSLAEIQLPESPGKVVKPQAKIQTTNESIKTTEPEKDVQNNINSCKKVKNSESEDLNGKDNTSKEDPSPTLAKVVGNSEDLPKSSPKKESDKTTHRLKDSEVSRSKKNQSASDSGSENDAKSRRTKRKDHGRRKRYDSSDDDRSIVKKSSKKHKDRKSDSSRDRSKSPKKDSEKSGRRNRKRSVSSEDGRGSRTHSKKSSPKRESRRKRDRRHRSSSSEEDRFKSLKESSPKKRRGLGEDERPSKTRSRSPKKAVKDNTSKRVRGDQSSEDERTSKTRSKSPKKSDKDSSSKKVCKDQSSEDERVSKTQSKSPNKTIEDSSSKEVRPEHSSEDEQHLKTQSKSPKNLIQDRPQKQTSSKSADSEDEQPSKIQDSPVRTEDKKERCKSSEREQRSRTRSKESPKKESRTSHKEREQKRKDTTFEDKRDAQDLDISSKKTSVSTSDDEHSKKDVHDVCKPEEVKPVEQMISVEPVKSTISRDRSPRSPLREKERGKCSSRSKSPGNAKSDSTTLESKSGSEPKDTNKKAPRNKSDSITSESSSGTGRKETDPEKKSLRHKDQQSPKKLSEETPKVALLEAEKPKQKADVSDGELSSSRENSPCRKQKIVVIRRPSSNSEVPVEGTMTVIRKEAPKQRIKIKRDNVVVIKKEEEKLPEKELNKTDDSVSNAPESVEEQKLEPGECPEAAPYVSSRKITLSNRKRTEKPADEPTGKRSKWGSFAASRIKAKQVSISTDSLKNWFPDFKLLKEPAVIEPVLEEPTSPTIESNDVEMPDKKDSEESKMTIPTRKSDHPPPTDEKPVAVEPMQLEEEGVTPSQILFVRNLVRPFTLLQLKELLKETGNMVEDKFWIDKIKSKCFVMYETEEEAVKTRSVLNGARWPISNPKILAVDFATEEDLEYHRSGAVDQPKPRPQSPPPNQPSQPRLEEEPRDRRPVEREGRRERAGHLPMREWDKDKVTQDSPEKQDRRRGEEGKSIDKEKKEKRARVGLEETPAKLLDDLFQKTKATPCIYWLPLTQEQIKAKAEQARTDRERRHQEQENKRPRSKQRTREMDTRRSSTRSRSPVTRRR